MMKRAPKTKLRSIMKTKTKTRVNLRSTTDAMVELITLLFLKSVAEEARAKAFEEKSATVRAHHIRAVCKKLLKKARG